MPCDKDFGYVILTWGLAWEHYGDLWQLTNVTMSEKTPEDHLIILREFLVGNKTLTTSSSIRARVNCSRVWVNCLCASVKLHLSCTVCGQYPVDMHSCSFDKPPLSLVLYEWLIRNVSPAISYTYLAGYIFSELCSPFTSCMASVHIVSKCPG